MDFTLTTEQQDLVKMVESFVKNEVAPIVQEMDEKEEWLPPHVLKKMGELGLMGMCIPEEYGGLGLGSKEYMLAMQAWTRAGGCCGSVLSIGASQIIGTLGIITDGTEEQKRKYLPKIASGEWVSSFILTEPGAGSDAGGIKTRAVKKGDHYVVNGSKTFITNAPFCEMGILIAVTDPSKGSRGVSAFIVESTFPGYIRGKKLKKMGNKSSPTGELFFEDMIVPAENLLGNEGEGFSKIAHSILEWERCVFGYYLGAMEYNFNLCCEYVKQREQFGQPIGNFQAMRHRIAEMKIDIDATRLLYYRIAWLIDNGMTPAPVEASVAKAFLGRAAIKNADNAVHIHGGYGYCNEYNVERSYRDFKLIEIGGGTTEVQKDIIANGILGRPIKKK